MTSFLWGWLAVTVFLASSTSGNNPDSWKCNQPDSFVVQISDTQAAIIRSAEWLVVPNSNEITIQPIPQAAAFDIQANISLEFQGDMTIQSLVEDQLDEDGLGYVMESDQQISWTNNDLVMGILDAQDDGDSMIRRCRLLTFARSCSCPAAVAVEIRQRAEACLESYLCGNANQVLYNQFTDLEAAELDDPLAASVFDENEVLTDNSLENFGSSPINYNEINLNEVVDFALKQAIALLQQSGKQSIPVSDVKKDFHIGGFIKGHFEATGGTFRDLTSLKRTSNVILSSDGQKYAAACGFGLGEAKVHFDHYKLKLATAVEGFITAQITGVALELKISVDYNQKPCVAQLEHVKITEFGTTNIEISGLGGLGQLLSKLMNWVTDHWRGPIAKVIEENLKNAAHQQLAKLQCEQYRPS